MYNYIHPVMIKLDIWISQNIFSVTDKFTDRKIISKLDK